MDLLNFVAFTVLGVILGIFVVSLYSKLHTIWFKRKTMKASAAYAAMFEMLFDVEFSKDILLRIPIKLNKLLNLYDNACDKDSEFDTVMAHITPEVLGCILTQQIIDHFWDEIEGEDTNETSELSRETKAAPEGAELRHKEE